MAGYSKTPLTQKLGIREDSRICFVNAPAGFERQLVLVDVNVVSPRSKSLDFALLFVTGAAALRGQFLALARKLSPAGMLWVAWPKRASGIATDLSENLVREIGLECGLVDVKVCAIDDVWSGLKFVYRLKDRPRP